MTITYWLQHADFESEEHGLIGRRDAQRAFREHGWPKELAYKDARERERRECCDPGIGFVSNDKRILHICPQASGRIMCHYHYDSTRWRLWMIPFRDQAQEFWFEDGKDDAEEVIARFFANDHKWLKRRAKAGSKAFDAERQ